MKLIFAAAVAAIVLCGCSTTTPEARLAQNQTSCASYGFKAGTDAYAACMMQLDIKEREADLAQRRRIGDALSQMGKSMQQPKPVTCNTFGTANRSFGGRSVYGQSTTTCY